MNNLDLISKLEKIGQLPPERSQDVDDFPLEEFDQHLQSFELPITLEIAKRLIKLSPPSNTGCFGVEWAILHLIESLNVEQLQDLIAHSEQNEVVDLLSIRLKNYLKKNNGEV